MAAILPLVKKYDAAIIALPNDHDEIPMEADKRVDLTAQDHPRRHRGVRHRAGRHRHRPAGHADRRRHRDHPGDLRGDAPHPRRVRGQHDLRRVQRLVRHARSPHPQRHLAADGHDLRPDQRDHGHPHAPRSSRRSRPPTCSSATTTGAWPGSRRTAPSRRRRRPLTRPELPDTPDRDPSGPGLLARRRGPRGPHREAGRRPAAHDGTGRVDLVLHGALARRGRRRAAADRSAAYASRPGVTVFDAASWNGIAIDSTCGGHGTCHKCKVQVTGGEPSRSRATTRARSPRPSSPRAGGSAAWSTRPATSASRCHRSPPGPKAATVGIGRQVILRPALQKRYVELDEPTLSDQRTDLVRLTDAIDDLELTADLHVLRRLVDGAAPVRLQGHRRRSSTRTSIDVEPGDTTARALRHRLRPRHHDGGRHPPRRRHRHPDGRRLDAQRAAAVRRRRDHPDQRHDDGPRRARPAPARRRAATLADARRRRSAARPASTRPTSTRSPSPATPR